MNHQEKEMRDCLATHLCEEERKERSHEYKWEEAGIDKWQTHSKGTSSRQAVRKVDHKDIQGKRGTQGKGRWLWRGNKEKNWGGK